MVNEKNEQPNLEQIVGAAKAAEGAAFRYKPINPKDTYDREAFVSALSEFSDLEQYRKALDQDPSNLGAREDLFGLLYGDPSFHRGFSPEDVKKSAKEAYKAGLEQTARYVEHNHNKFFNDLLDDKAMDALLMSVPLYKTENAEHNDPLTKCIVVPLKSPINLAYFIMKPFIVHGPKLLEYNYLNNNCQYFVKHVLEQNQGLFSPEVEQFIFQDIDSVLNDTLKQLTWITRGPSFWDPAGANLRLE